MARISTSSSGGNVNIQDTNGNAINSSGGALDVNIVSSGPSGTAISVYNEVTSIAMNATSNVLTYTVGIGQTLTLSRVSASSDSISTIEVDFDSIANAKSRLGYANYNTIFEYGNLLLFAGTIITVIATNNSTQGVASFNATLQGTLQ